MLTRLVAPLGLVLALCLPVGPAAAAAEPSARASAPDGTLLRGCHDYAYRYRVQHAGDDWMLEIIVQDRTGTGVASTALFANQDAKSGKRTFRLCRAGTKAGKFTFVGVLTVRDGYSQAVHAVDPTSFWLTRD